MIRTEKAIAIKTTKPLRRKPRVIAVDVDGTLLIRGIINRDLAAWCKNRKQDGYFMILWSARGKKHASNVAKLAGLCNIFDCIISKPGYIVDNKGWSWTQYTKVIKRIDA